MEIKIFRNHQAFRDNKPLYCARIECVDLFDFSDSLNVFRSIYGTGVIIVFVCV